MAEETYKWVPSNPGNYRIDTNGNVGMKTDKSTGAYVRSALATVDGNANYEKSGIGTVTTSTAEQKYMRIGSNVYRCCKINGTWVMAENLREHVASTKYPNSEFYRMPEGLFPGEYGYYYTWEAARAVCNRCPGWHLPTRAEMESIYAGCGSKPEKMCASYEWQGSEINPAPDSFGFSALPSSYMNVTSYTLYENTSTTYPRQCYLWTSDLSTDASAVYFTVAYRGRAGGMSSNVSYGTLTKTRTYLPIRLVYSGTATIPQDNAESTTFVDNNVIYAGGKYWTASNITSTFTGYVKKLAPSTGTNKESYINMDGIAAFTLAFNGYIPGNYNGYGGVWRLPTVDEVSTLVNEYGSWNALLATNEFKTLKCGSVNGSAASSVSAPDTVKMWVDSVYAQPTTSSNYYQMNIIDVKTLTSSAVSVSKVKNTDDKYFIARLVFDPVDCMQSLNTYRQTPVIQVGSVIWGSQSIFLDDDECKTLAGVHDTKVTSKCVPAYNIGRGIYYNAIDAYNIAQRWAGWELPTIDDYTELINAYGGLANLCKSPYFKNLCSGYVRADTPYGNSGTIYDSTTLYAWVNRHLPDANTYALAAIECDSSGTITVRFRHDTGGNKLLAPLRLVKRRERCRDVVSLFGRKYSTVTFGDTEWMGENIKYDATLSQIPANARGRTYNTTVPQTAPIQQISRHPGIFGLYYSQETIAKYFASSSPYRLSTSWRLPTRHEVMELKYEYGSWGGVYSNTEDFRTLFAGTYSTQNGWQGIDSTLSIMVDRTHALSAVTTPPTSMMDRVLNLYTNKDSGSQNFIYRTSTDIKSVVRLVHDKMVNFGIPECGGVHSYSTTIINGVEWITTNLKAPTYNFGNKAGTTSCWACPTSDSWKNYDYRNGGMCYSPSYIYNDTDHWFSTLLNTASSRGWRLPTELDVEKLFNAAGVDYTIMKNKGTPSASKYLLSSTYYGTVDNGYDLLNFHAIKAGIIPIDHSSIQTNWYAGVNAHFMVAPTKYNGYLWSAMINDNTSNHCMFLHTGMNPSFRTPIRLCRDI